MTGHIRRRGKQSWELKFEIGRNAKGERITQYHSFKGTKKAAQFKLAELIAAVGKGAYVEPSKMTVAEFVRARVDQWEAAGHVSARTAQRYRQLIENQIVPHLGTKLLQALARLDVETWHVTLRNSGLAARTIGHAHRVLGKALRDAEDDNLITKNVCKLRKPPKVAETEMVIVRDVPSLVDKLYGARLYTAAILALFTGTRFGGDFGHKGTAR